MGSGFHAQSPQKKTKKAGRGGSANAAVLPRERTVSRSSRRITPEYLAFFVKKGSWDERTRFADQPPAAGDGRRPRGRNGFAVAGQWRLSHSKTQVNTGRGN